jgi:hypothetical protein
METLSKARVVAADTLDGSLIITFADGKAALYPADLLFAIFPQANELLDEELCDDI